MAVRFPSKKILSCIWVAIPVDWVILHWYACGVEGRVGGWTDVQSHDYKSLWKFLRCIDNQIFLPMVLCCTHKSSAIIIVLCELEIFAGLNGTSESLQVRWLPD